MGRSSNDVTVLRVIGLGLRFARPRDYVAWARAVAIVVLTVMATLAYLLLFSANEIVSRQQAVEDARTAFQPESVNLKARYLLSGEYVNHWDGLQLTRVLIADGARFPTVHPPGIPRNPLPDEVFVSPAFAQQLPSRQTLQLVVGDADIAGTITPSGLRSPDELRIIQGTPATSHSREVMTRTKSFGASGQRIVDLTGPLGFVLPLVLLIAFVPMLLALVLASRLRAPETSHRFALLRAFGVSRNTCRAIAAVELSPPALAGAVIAWLIFAFGWQNSSHVPGTDFSYWPGDTHVDPLVQLAVPVACLLFTLVVAGVSAGPRAAVSTRPAHSLRAPGWWWLLPVVAGAALLIYSAGAVSDPIKAKLAAIGAAALIMISLPAAMHFGAHQISEALARRATTSGALIGGRRIGRRQGASFRLAIAVALGILAVGAAAPFVQTLKGDPRQGQEGLAAATGYNVFIGDTSLTPRQADELPGTRRVLSASEGVDAGKFPVAVLFATCQALESMVEVHGCTGRPQWINITDQSPSPFRSSYKAPIRVRYGTFSLNDLPIQTVFAPLGEQFRGAILLPRPVGRVHGPPEGLLVNLANGTDALDTFEAALGNAAPNAFSSNSYQELVDQAGQYLGYAQFLQMGAAAGLTGLTIALLAAALRSVSERRRESAVLGILGASLSTKAYAHALSQAVPIIVCTMAAALTSVLFWICLAAIDPGARLPPSAYVALLTAPAVLTGLITGVTLPAAFSEPRGTDQGNEARLWS